MELAGYKVWHDLDQLKGGDYFWDKIEGAIRNDAFRLIAVVSKVAVGKPGVKEEWAVAGTIERSLLGFIIPVRIDDILSPVWSVAVRKCFWIRGWHRLQRHARPI